MDTLSVYIEDLKGKIIEGVKNAPDRCRPLAGLHIVTDAGNGAGGFFPERVLAPLGADISGSLYLDPMECFPTMSPTRRINRQWKSSGRRLWKIVQIWD